MVGTPDVDQLIGRPRLLEMISEIAAEIGPASVGLLDWPILIVTELRRSEQGELDRLPFVMLVEAFRALEHPFVDEAPGPKRFQRLIGKAFFVHLGLGREDIVMDTEQGEV